MALRSVAERAPQLSADFLKLCRQAGLVGRGRKWISLDRLWSEVHLRSEFKEITVGYLQLLLEGASPERTIIVTPDTMSTSFGATPVVFLAAEQLGYPVAVWQEMGDVVSQKSTLIGTLRGGLDCFVLQDVVRHGTIVVDVVGCLKSRQWRLAGYACFVLNCQGKMALDVLFEDYRRRMGSELELDYLAGIDDIG